MDISQFSPQNGLVLGILKKNNMESKDICFLVSYDEKYENISKISVHNNIRRYCKLHGYTLWVDKQETKYDDRVSQWQKIKVALNILENNSFKWLFFMDSDCLIMDTKKKLEEFLDEQFSFIIPSQSVPPPDTPIKNSQNTENIITSHFFVKNDEIGKKILLDIWNASDWPKEMSINTFDHEQRQGRITINKEEFKPHVKVIKEKLLNRFWYMNNPYMVLKHIGVNDNVWKPGDFTVHVTGYPLDVKYRHICDLNFFSGGILTCFERRKDSISFTPLQNLKDVKIVFHSLDGKALINYKISEVTVNQNYYLYIDEQLNEIDIIIKCYDNNNNLISLVLLEI